MCRAICVFSLGFYAILVTPTFVAAQEQPKGQKRPEVEVVFCLDTTGSMGGLIDAAKQKIWAISNQITSGTPTPHVKIGLVAFRDRGDAYITKVFDLTDDLDAVHGNLMNFRAEGGGDIPESVNQALNESVTKISWSKDKKTLKMIFLVGDAPPHMDYPDDVKYPDTCKLAVKNDIIINTVQCGNDAQCRKYWQDICRLAEGSYVQIDQKGGPIVTIATPFDKDLAKINEEISKTTLVFGSKEAQMDAKGKAEVNAKLAAPAAADRAAFYARAGKGGTAYDLLTNIQKGTVKLESLKKDELPPELQKLTLEEQKAYLKKLEERRKDLSEEAIALDKKRNEFIAKKQTEDAKGRARDSFDNQVLQILQTQANRNGVIQYGSADDKKK
ncbi:MAG: VWA domain-containing protein [Planctomycetes bacterium]|nr:VWA domain-containing protein [Planctomycetota bacterium]